MLNGLMRRQVFPAGMRIVMTEQLEDTAYVIGREWRNSSSSRPTAPR